MKLLITNILIFFTAFIMVSCGVSPENISTSAENVGTVIEVSAAEGSSIAAFSTKYSERTGRAHNIRLAAQKINGKTLKPGQEFSYNETVGPTGRSYGFKKDKIFVNGKTSEGYGGGVCQVSSTLYNAALKAGLEITERHPHSKPVAYVAKDKDAATSYGGMDFKFKNSLKQNIIIKASAGNGSVNVELCYM